MRTLPCLLLATILLPTAGSAQERRALLGKVLDGNGKPLPHATITLTRDEGGAVGLVPADTVTASSDAKGTFQAKVLSGALYTGWAIGPETEGRAMVSAPRHWLVAGGFYELACAQRGEHARLRLVDAAPWQKDGPLRGELFIDLRGEMSIPVTFAADGTAVLPLLPAGRHALAILQADGQLFDWRELGQDNAIDLTLLPPVAVPMRVVDEQNRPLAKAVLSQRIGETTIDGPFDLFGTPQRARWRTLGTTDQDGKFSAQLPLANDPIADSTSSSLVFRASLDACAESHSGWLGGAFRDGQRLPRDTAITAVEFVLHKADPCRGQLLASAGLPLAGVPVRIAAICKVAEGGGWSHLPRTFDMVTDAEGFYGVPGLPLDAYELEVLIATPPALATAAAGKHALVRPALAPFLPIARGHATSLPLVDLAKTIELPLRVLDTTKGPARGAIGAAFCVSQVQGLVPGALYPMFGLDPSGRVDLRLAEGRWLLCGLGQDGCGFVVVDSQDNVHPDTIELQPFLRMRCHVVDKDGKDLAGAWVQRQGRRQTRGGGESQLRAMLRDHLDSFLLGEARSDAHGMLTMRLLGGAEEEETGSVRIGIDGNRATIVNVEAGDDVVEVVIE